MAIFDIEPGQNPEAAATLKFYKAGFAENSGVVLTSEGDVNFAGSATFGPINTSALTVTGATVLNGPIQLREGSNAIMGVATMVAGVATVPNTAVTANSRIFVTSNSDGGTPGAFRISSRIPGTSFNITCTQNTNTSQVAWLLLNPA
jgi:hypothetical protein